VLTAQRERQNDREKERGKRQTDGQPQCLTAGLDLSVLSVDELRAGRVDTKFNNNGDDGDNNTLQRHIESRTNNQQLTTRGDNNNSNNGGQKRETKTMREIICCGCHF